MKGIFRKSYFKYVLCLLFILPGTFAAVKFGLWGIDSVKSGRVAEAIFAFSFIFICLLFGSFAVVLFNYNRGASLTIESGKIDARFGFGTELHEDVRDVVKAVLARDGKGLRLIFRDKTADITGLENAKDICGYILSEGGGRGSVMTPDEAAALLKTHEKKFGNRIVPTVLFGILMFANIAWCVILTDGKDLGEFNGSDTLIFVAFAVAELTAFVLTLFFADRSGKQLKVVNDCKAVLLSCAAKEHKKDSLEKYPDPIGVKYLDDFSYRIVIFAPKSNVFAYMLERFDASTNLWISCYTSAKKFDTLSELNDDIDVTFENEILE